MIQQRPQILVLGQVVRQRFVALALRFLTGAGLVEAHNILRPGHTVLARFELVAFVFLAMSTKVELDTLVTSIVISAHVIGVINWLCRKQG